MAQEFRAFQLDVPPNTPIATPATFAIGFPARIVRHLRVRIPPGPAGNVGFAVAAAGVQILPWNVGRWIVADNEIMDWDLDGFHTSGSWQVFAYNLGVYQHSLYTQWYLDLPQRAAQPLGLMPLDLNP